MVLLRRPRATQLAESAQFRITSSRERASRENTTPQPDHGDPQGITHLKKESETTFWKIFD